VGAEKVWQARDATLIFGGTGQNEKGFQVLRLVLSLEKRNLEQAIELLGEFYTEVGCWTAVGAIRIQEGYDYFYSNLNSLDLN
jgi:hypothetical protein